MYIYGKMWRGFDVDKLRFSAMAEKSQLAVGFNCFSYRFKKINPNSVTWHPFAGEGAIITHKSFSCRGVLCVAVY